MKGGKHDSDPVPYPLPVQAVEALAAITKSGVGMDMAQGTMTKSVKRFADILTLHGIRSSLTDWARQRGDVSLDVQNSLLAHKDKAERAAYACDQLAELRRPMTHEWADVLLLR